jgi:hypothetical protein
VHRPRALLRRCVERHPIDRLLGRHFPVARRPAPSEDGLRAGPGSTGAPSRDLGPAGGPAKTPPPSGGEKPGCHDTCLSSPFIDSCAAIVEKLEERSRYGGVEHYVRSLSFPSVPAVRSGPEVMSTEERALHHGAVHVGRRVGAAIVTVALLLASLAVVYDSRSPVHLLGLLLPAAAFAVSWLTIWRTSRVYASEGGLRIESGRVSRWVPWQDVTGVVRPFWVINPLASFESRSMTLRDGTRVIFFPAPGAVAMVKARLKEVRESPVQGLR